MNTLLVTGSSGLIGSEVCQHFHDLGWKIIGVDNNQRAVFFGEQGDTRWNQQRLEQIPLQRRVHNPLPVQVENSSLDQYNPATEKRQNDLVRPPQKK